MASDDEGDNLVTYGAPFSDDENGMTIFYRLYPPDDRLRSLCFGKKRSVPVAYEQRVLNERGKPMRFHGAFTGGFSAGYFNTVGSKEGFKPQTFHSSRSSRNRDTNNTQRPEDFMDEEDFGEFGIAPRQIRMAHEFDDRQVRDTMRVALGEQSVIPDSGGVLKNYIVPSKISLGDRMLRRLGWAEREPTLNLEDEEEKSAIVSSSRQINDHQDSYIPQSTPLFSRLCFNAKLNTFGLGYSGLDPNLAMGRVDGAGESSSRMPEESPSALVQRYQSLGGKSTFNPSSGRLNRVGIRGVAFGSGVLDDESTLIDYSDDIYSHDKLTDYDWSIGSTNNKHRPGQEDGDEDEEEDELQAARSGRLSSGKRGPRKLGRRLGQQHSGQRITIDGWSAPTDRCDRIKDDDINMISGFLRACFVNQDHRRLDVGSNSIHLPPGYMPVFNPQCVRSPSSSSTTTTGSSSTSNNRPLNATSRAKLFESEGGPDSLMDPIESLRLKASAAGLPVPPISASPIKSEASINPPVDDVKPAPLPMASLQPTAALVKHFTDEPDKQARFDAYQILLRRGFDPEQAYTRCSGAVDLSGEERAAEFESFQTLLLPASQRNLAPSTSSSTLQYVPVETRTSKQQLLANQLANRFRSAGSMDIGHELSDHRQREEMTKRENFDKVDPRDHAVATQSYGFMTRRRLAWHPDKLLCKRINVADPFPESTFVGCPEDRRFRPDARRRHRHGLGKKTGDDFSLFDLLDVNRGFDLTKQPVEDVDAIDDEVEEEPNNNVTVTTDTDSSLVLPEVIAPDRSVIPDRGGSLLFASLFADQPPPPVDEEELKTQPEPTSQNKSPTGPNLIGPARPESKPLDGVGVEESRPPLSLFKSIFASDEELSDTDDQDGADEEIEQVEPFTAPCKDISLFSHLFGADTEELGAPLSTRPIFSTSHNAQEEPAKQSIDDGVDSAYGPELPPPSSPSSAANPALAMPRPIFTSSSKIRRDKSSDILWKEKNVFSTPSSAKRSSRDIRHDLDDRKHKKHKRHKHDSGRN